MLLITVLKVVNKIIGILIKKIVKLQLHLNTHIALCKFRVSITCCSYNRWMWISLVKLLNSGFNWELKQAMVTRTALHDFKEEPCAWAVFAGHPKLNFTRLKHCARFLSLERKRVNKCLQSAENVRKW